ncbi:MAG: hypothetical protein ABJ251_05455 [Paracoccaceae bacterium]
MVRRTIELFLPALIPSWRFFKSVEASPRIEYRILQGSSHSEWTSSFERPVSLTPLQFAQRLLWNSDWNNHLFMVSCAERLTEHVTQHSIDELNTRISRRINDADLSGLLQFRLLFLSRHGHQLVKEIEYESQPVALADIVK